MIAQYEVQVNFSYYETVEAESREEACEKVTNIIMENGLAGYTEILESCDASLIEDKDV